MARTEGIEVLADLMAEMDDGPLTSDAYLRKVAEDPSYAERGDRNLRSSSPAMFAAMLQQIPQLTDRLDRLAAIEAPTLVIVGEEDTPFLQPSERMAETIPSARLEVLAGGGHSPQFESPDAWWAAVSGFLAEVAADVPRRPDRSRRRPGTDAGRPTRPGATRGARRGTSRSPG